MKQTLTCTLILQDVPLVVNAANFQLQSRFCDGLICLSLPLQLRVHLYLPRSSIHTYAVSQARALSSTVTPSTFSSPPSSPTLTLCVIQSSQGDGYPSPRSAYALHFLKRLIRLIDCPPPRLWGPSADSVWGWRRRVCGNQVCIDIFIKWLFLLPVDRPCNRTNGSR